MKPLTDEAHILFIEFIATTAAFIAVAGAASQLYMKSAEALRQSRSEAGLWDAAAASYSLQADALKALGDAYKVQLKGLGYEWEGSPIDEWPEIIEGCPDTFDVN